MQERAERTEATLRDLEFAVQARDMEYEHLKKELEKANMRTEGMLKALGSTVKDTIIKNLGASGKSLSKGALLSPRLINK